MPKSTTVVKRKPVATKAKKAEGSKMRGSKLAQEFAAALSRRKDESGFGLRGFAEKCGISFVYVGELVRGQKAPTLETIEKISAGLGISPAALLEDCPSWRQG